MNIKTTSREEMRTQESGVLRQGTLRQWLLIHSQQSENCYGPFTGELLRSEGLNGFSIHDLKDGFLDFAAGDLAILTRCFVSVEDAKQLKTAVESGLRLVCFQPSWNLVKQFGWAPAKSVLHPGWIGVGEGYPGAGEKLQTHVPIALYRKSEGEAEYSVIADAIDSEWQPAGSPAAVRQRCGVGEVVFFFYDLPKAVARIRFGNPELASLLNSGTWGWLHAIDLFVGHVDERVLHLPQAELHTQILAKVLTEICAYPLARLWYFEKAEQRAAANFSSDDDWSTPEQFRDLAESVTARGGHDTFYLMEDTHLSDEEVVAYRAQGHSFGPHINAVSNTDEITFAFPRCLREQTATFRARYGQSSLSLQCHYAPWQGYMDWLPDFVAEGYRLLYNYISHPQWLNLFMCGAGRPIKFVNERGEIFNCYQQPMQSYDDASLVKRISSDLPSVIAEFEVLLRAATERFHTAIGIGSHPVSFSTYSKPFLTSCFDLLQDAGVPIYSGDDWCRFTQRRDGIAMEYSRHSNGSVQLQLKHVEGDFTLMIPARDDAKTISVNGTEARSTPLRRLEESYHFVPVNSASTTITFTR